MAFMQSQHPNPGPNHNHIPPRHQSGRGRPRGDIHHQKPQVYKSRASQPNAAAGLIQNPPYVPNQIHAGNRVLLGQPQLAMFSTPAPATNQAGAALMRANPPFFPQHNMAATQPFMIPFSTQQLQPTLFPQGQSTQQPINLGLSQPQGVPVMNQNPTMNAIPPIRGQMANPPVMYNPQDQVERAKHPPKQRSRAIKIVDPNTKSEVKVDGNNQDTPPLIPIETTTHPLPSTTSFSATISEFKSKVQSSLNPLAEEMQESGQAIRPNAIITRPDAKVEENLIPSGVPAVAEGGLGDSNTGTIDTGTSEQAILGMSDQLLSSSTPPEATPVDGESEEIDSHDVEGGEGEIKETGLPDSITREQEPEETGPLSSGGSGVMEEANKTLDSGISLGVEQDSGKTSSSPIPSTTAASMLDNESESVAEIAEPSVENEDDAKVELKEVGVVEDEEAVQLPPPPESSDESPPVSAETESPEKEEDVQYEMDSSPLPPTATVPDESVTTVPEESITTVPEESVATPPVTTQVGMVTVATVPPVMSGTSTPPIIAKSDHKEEAPPIRDNFNEDIADSAALVTLTSSTQVTAPISSTRVSTATAPTTNTVHVAPTPTSTPRVATPTTTTGTNIAPSTGSTAAPPKKDPRKINKGKATGSATVSERTTYDRDFLMSFRESCKEKPEDLEVPDVLRGGGGGGGNRFDSRRSSRRGSESKKIITHQPAMAAKVELRKAEVPWIRAQERLTEMEEEQSRTTELYRKFQGILNKLTPQKFQALAEQALGLEINTEDRLKGCIDKIFTKALEEPNFSIAYANLCKVMSPIKVEWVQEEGKTKSTNFRRMLLTKCQQEFEKDKKDDETIETMKEAIEKAETEEKRLELQGELTNQMTRMRKRSLGNIRFIGELFKLKMLSETIMHECITRLLKSTSDEESLECFAGLIKTTGKDLDKPEAKSRIDAYFKRITDINKKGKIPARIKFMLQDVQELRDNEWIPRVRQDKQLKTIDQIRIEAKAEEEKEKEMIQQHQVLNMGMGRGGGGRDGKRGSKDEWSQKPERDRRDREREREREKVDHSKLQGLLSRRAKEKSGAQMSLGPNTSLRPTGWNKGKGGASSNTSSVQSDSKSSKPARSSTSNSKKSEGRGPGNKGSGSGVKRSHTTPEAEKEAALMTVSKFTNQTPQTHPPPPPSRDAPAQAILKPTPSTKDKLNEATVQRKTISIIEEFVTNSDLKEAVDCVKEMSLSAMMNVVVREGINHVLEHKAEQRTCTGRLFKQLIHEKVLSEHKFLDGLNDVLEYADDMSIDIPKIWDYLGEVLTPVMAHSTINFALLGSIRSSLVESGKAAVLVAKVLRQCLSELGSQEAVRDLWTQSRLDWASLGMRAEDLGEFLERQKLGFLQPEETPPYHIAGLQELLSSDQTNKDIMTSLEKFKSYDLKSARFIRSLAFSVVFATVTGSGDSAIFKKDLFERRCQVIKECKGAKYSLEVLYGFQVAVAKLKHPPKLLDEMFNILYNLEIIEEDDFYTWRDKGTENFGKGSAVMVVRSFFDWLQLDGENPP